MVSVIIPNYNRENLIIRAVNSVLNQSYQDIEVIVVDDCSTDNSLKMLDKIKDVRLKIFRLKENSGACVARNKGIEEAKGEYISFLDSDDEWLPDKIKIQLKFLENNNCDAVFTQFYYFGLNKYGKKIEIRPNLKNDINYLSQILYANCVAMDTLMVKRDVFNSIKFDEKLLRYQDWDIAIQIAKEYRLSFLSIPTLKVYEQRDSITYSTSKEKKYMSLKHLYNKYQELILQYPEAQSHFLWTMGMYSFCIKKGNIRYIQQSIKLGKRDLKKIVVLGAIKMGLGNLIGKMYAKNH